MLKFTEVKIIEFLARKLSHVVGLSTPNSFDDYSYIRAFIDGYTSFATLEKLIRKKSLMESFWIFHVELGAVRTFFRQLDVVESWKTYKKICVEH